MFLHWNKMSASTYLTPTWISVSQCCSFSSCTSFAFKGTVCNSNYTFDEKRFWLCFYTGKKMSASTYLTPTWISVCQYRSFSSCTSVAFKGTVCNSNYTFWQIQLIASHSPLDVHVRCVCVQCWLCSWEQRKWPVLLCIYLL